MPLPLRKVLAVVFFATASATFVGTASAADPEPRLRKNPPVLLGVRAAGGGRYDNIRMCVASSQGTPGGPAADIAFIVAVPLDAAGRGELTIVVPVARPVLFGTAFKMLQLEPELFFTYRALERGELAFVFGSTLGLSLHYGPDYLSPRAMDERTASFFALGPMFGGYAGLDWGKRWRFGLHPYVIPMVGISDDRNHTGIVVGGMAEASYRFPI
jgi:hypothetical protein